MTTHRILNRRTDPLRRRTLEEWRQAFARFRILTDALICASRKVAWDYPNTAPVTKRFVEAYHRLATLPPKEEIERCLVRLGYHPVQAHRALTAWGQSAKVRDASTLNAYGRHIESLVAPAFREEPQGSVSVCLSPARKNPGNS